MNSKLYVGQVNHRRHTPTKHEFKYSMFMLLLDLDELPHLFDRYLLWSARRFNIAWFNRNKHFGPADKTLKSSIYELVEQQSGITLDGPVMLLTHLSYFGYGFNPVSFYYCYDKNASEIRAIVAEVNNTPWGEQHCYVFSELDNLGTHQNHVYALEKNFHVSPFNPMDQNYKWQLSSPDDRLTVHIENWKSEKLVFDASLNLHAHEINSSTLSSHLLKFPFMTLKIVISIYYEALKLWLKGTPVYTHPIKIIPSFTKNK